MQVVAVNKDNEPIPNAPVIPIFDIDKKTVTTNAFSGIPKKFIIKDRCESGTKRLRNVPIDGKYIPTTISNRKKPRTKIGNDIWAGSIVDPYRDKVHVDRDMAMVATPKKMEVKFSVGTPIFVNCPNNVEPKRQHAIKQEKIVPYGVLKLVLVLPALENMDWTAFEMAGGHCKTNIYIAASKNACTAPTKIIFGSCKHNLIASLVESLEDDSLVLDEESVSICFGVTCRSPTFSFHNTVAKIPPNAKNKVDNSNGPLGPPRTDAAIPDI
jgi:hypothetical protein